MNIFVISDDPVECAQALDDLRLNKMIIETAQLLSTALHVCGYTGSLIYKKTHINHPCSIWTRQASANYDWLYDYFLALLAERYFRCTKGHRSADIANELNVERHRIPSGELTPFANCSLHKNLPIFDAYKQTMRDKWATDKRPAKWTRRGKPSWA